MNGDQLSLTAHRPHHRHGSPPVGPSRPEHRDLRAVAVDRIELRGQGFGRVRDYHEACRSGSAAARRYVGLISPPPQRQAATRCGTAGSTIGQNMIDVGACSRRSEEKRAVTLVDRLLKQAKDAVVQGRVGRRDSEHIDVVMAHPRAVSPTPINGIWKHPMTPLGTNAVKGRAVLGPPAGDRIEPEAAAFVMALRDIRHGRVRIAGEHCEHGDPPALRHQRRQASPRRNDRVVEVRRYSKDRPVHTKERRDKVRADLLDAATGRTVTLRARDHDVIVSDAMSSVKCGSLPELTEILGKIASTIRSCEPTFEHRPWPASDGDALLLLALSSFWPEFTADGSPHHLTLAYALPLALDITWWEWACRCSSDLVRGRQLVTVPAANLVAVEPARDLERRHQRLLRQHAVAGTAVKEHGDHAAFLSHWSAFSQQRYEGLPTRDEQEALHAVLTTSGCTVREFISHGEVIARSVVCRHDPSRSIFDLMVTWEPQHARYRPGIYSGVYNVLDAARQGYRYSLCYGQFAYKDDIVGASRRLSLNDLITSHASADSAGGESGP